MYPLNNDEKYFISLVAAPPDVGNIRVKLGHFGNSVEIEVEEAVKILIDCRRKDNIISLMFGVFFG